MSLRLPVGQVALKSGKGFVTFNPTEECRELGDHVALNPITARHKVTHAARIILGLGILAQDKLLTPAQREQAMRRRRHQAEKLVIQVRKDQTGGAAATIISGRGAYTHSDGTIVDEMAMQITIINFGQPQEAFELQIENLADILRETFDQETVLVEITVNGVTNETWEVMAPKV